jgi:hypothetical protein
MVPRATVIITLGGNHSIGVSDEKELIYTKGSSRFSMGVKTQTDIDRLCEYLQRLKIHFDKDPE